MTSNVDNNSQIPPEASKNRDDNKRHGARTEDIFAQYLENFRKHGAATKVDGGDGDDTIDAEGWHVRVDGGKGNDTINARGFDVWVKGGEGDDVINARGATSPGSHCGHSPMGHFREHFHRHSIPAVRSSGGDGDDIINSEGFSWVRGGAGNDTIHIGGGSALGGSGDDFITNTGGSAALSGGAGNDKIVSTGMININSSINGGAGDDEIYASGSHITIFGGTGNDTITLDGTDDRGVVFMDPHGHVGVNTELRSFINAGLGDDQISLVKDAKAEIAYFKDSGHDSLEGASERSTVRFGPGLTFETAAFSSQGDDLVIAFAESEGSLTIKNYAQQGVPMLEFAGGRILDASTTIAYAGGDPDAYRGDDGPSTSASSDPEESED